MLINFIEKKIVARVHETKNKIKEKKSFLNYNTLVTQLKDMLNNSKKPLGLNTMKLT